MALLTATQLREHIETDLADSALQRYLDDANKAIVERFGAHAGSGDLTEQLEGYTPWLLPLRQIATVTSVTEHVGGTGAETTTILAADDYRIWDDGRAVQRLASGTNPRSNWGERVVVVFAPRDDDALRTRITVDLCRLAVEYDAKRASRHGDFSASTVDYQDEREAILREIGAVEHGPVTIA